VKSHGNLFGGICDFGNLLEAARKASLSKGRMESVGRFRSALEPSLLAIQNELLDKTYQPGAYRTKIITRPKIRMISAAPFRDRVVHHALCNVVMPLFERKMIFDQYSNRKGKGTHAAIRRAQHCCRRFRYVLKCDVRKYFPSIDHAVLKTTMRKTIRCRDTLWLLDTILDASNAQEAVCTVFPGDDLADAAGRRVGLPIGNLTSQWFACIYLDPLDHWVKESLGCMGYVRYVDDFLLFSDDKEQLAQWRAAIVARLAQDRLRLHERKSRVFRTSDGVTFLGQRVWPFRRRLVAANIRSARRRLQWNARQYLSGSLSREALVCRWQSWRGHALQADGRGILANILAGLRQTLGAGGTKNTASCGAVRGTTQRRTSAVPAATTTTPRPTPTTTSGSVVRGGFGTVAGNVPRQSGTGRSTDRPGDSSGSPPPVTGFPPAAENENQGGGGAGSPDTGRRSRRSADLLTERSDTP